MPIGGTYSKNELLSSTVIFCDLGFIRGKIVAVHYHVIMQFGNDGAAGLDK